MKNSNFPKGVDGFIPKDSICEYEEKCNKSGAHCQRDSTIRYHCGYCKSFRMIDIMRKQEVEIDTPSSSGDELVE